jgi:hypothetical protein
VPFTLFMDLADLFQTAQLGVIVPDGYSLSSSSEAS